MDEFIKLFSQLSAQNDESNSALMKMLPMLTSAFMNGNKKDAENYSASELSEKLHLLVTST